MTFVAIGALRVKRFFFQGTIDSLQERVDKKWTIESELDWRYQLLDILRMLQSLLGEDKVLCGYILPHIKIAGTSDVLR